MVINSAAILEIEMYSDAQIAAWDEADKLSPDDRSAVLARLATQP